MKINSNRYRRMAKNERLFFEAGLLDECSEPTAALFSHLGSQEAEKLFDGFAETTGQDSSILLAHTMLEQLTEDENCDALLTLLYTVYDHACLDDPHFLADFMSDTPRPNDQLLAFCYALSEELRCLLYECEDYADDDGGFFPGDYE